MKTFKQHLREFAQYSPSDLVFDVHSGNSSSLKIPISGPMFKRIWPDTIRATVFHTTSLEGLEGIKKLEGGKKSISAFFSMFAKYMETGVASGGDVHVVVEMDADVLVSAKDDIWSQVDKTGRRWVELSWFQNAAITGPKFDRVEKELTTLITALVKKYVPKEKGNVFEIWSDMKSHLKAGREGGGERMRLVIKDYFDGVEKIIKKNSEVMGNIFYGYAKSKRQTEQAWDEQVVNNIEITKVHIIDFTTKAPSLQGQLDATKDLVKSNKWPMKVWDATETMDLEVYTRQVAQAEVRTR